MLTLSDQMTETAAEVRRTDDTRQLQLRQQERLWLVMSECRAEILTLKRNTVSNTQTLQRCVVGVTWHEDKEPSVLLHQPCDLNTADLLIYCLVLAHSQV